MSIRLRKSIDEQKYAFYTCILRLVIFLLIPICFVDIKYGLYLQNNIDSRYLILRENVDSPIQPNSKKFWMSK